MKRLQVLITFNLVFSICTFAHFPIFKFSSMIQDTIKTYNVYTSRTFDAPIEVVWKAWSDGNEVMKWWGPTGFTSPSAKMDFREGGTSLVCMRAPKEFGGMDMYNTWTYTKIIPKERIEFTLNFSDKDGNIFDPAQMGMPPGIPKGVPHVITFKKIGDKTEMSIIEFGYKDEQTMQMSKAGLEQCLDKMAACFKS
jgi:uncharacterized protein YndB with AHSA1/START domain